VKHDLADIPIPLPLSPLPLPAKWRMAFMEPIDPGRYISEDTSPDRDHAEAMAQDLRRIMQAELDAQVAKRGRAFW
ncbi:MAG TPA: hypothetical protein VNX21_08575, partial [Candidatus Thermoplasmatota archaeon]|nr:hypothetical protein [Candidatus Thermoplasmatota archaeon]